MHNFEDYVHLYLVLAGTNISNDIDIPILLWDERLSTVAAEKSLIEADISRKKRSKVIDKIAANIILQSFLDFLNSNS